MSTIKLPELPVSPEGVYFEGDGDSPGELVPMYSGIQMRAYAEEAVRQALAAQQTVAWLREVTPGGGVWRHYVSLEEPISGFPAIERKHRLAIIPEPIDG